uniref:Uncharacterized protein n=2 Tax=Picea TaxID=3328 RepID=A0A117NIT3_PICGL|nr:hypothetical protein ABT39_MTgene218 [Picea glauca]QHR90094.1 hypothetical protein Q903MT_gene4117 [Picea sitchensis]
MGQSSHVDSCCWCCSLGPMTPSAIQLSSLSAMWLGRTRSPQPTYLWAYWRYFFFPELSCVTGRFVTGRG